MTPQPVLMRLSAQISKGSERTEFLFSFSACNLNADFPNVFGEGFYCNMHNKYLCFEQSLHIKFVIITIQFESCCNLLNFQLIKALTICQPLY